MDPDRFVKVYDIVDAGFQNWTFPALGLIFIGLGLATVLFPRILKAIGIPYFAFESWQRYIPLFIGIIWTLMASAMTYLPYQHQRRLAEQGQCRLVEGRVENFRPAGANTTLENFTVSGVTFTYTDAAPAPGFNVTATHGGPIRADQYVRICYNPAGNTILRLEIRDFAGIEKSYARVFNPFARTEVGRTGGQGAAFWYVPWFGNSLFAFWLLDGVAIWALFLPYLRIFIRLKATPLAGAALPTDLAPDTKIKLGNSLLYWDRAESAIWLRPRGYNLFQLPGVVAKLAVGADERAIVREEVRMSFSLPVTLVFFLAFFYLAISTKSANAQVKPPLVFLLAVAAMFGAFGVFATLMIRRRMQSLVNDALRELTDIASASQRRARSPLA